MREPLIAVSACLVGQRCRHDGAHCLDPELRARWTAGEALAVCPEELGGLTTPRPPAEIVGGSGEDVLEGRAQVRRLADGTDVTAQFLDGARETLRLVRAWAIRDGIFKGRSPSCGAGTITRNGESVPGHGVCAALLRRDGVRLTER